MTLGEYLKAAMARPFQWGAHDCCTFCAEWMGILTGQDILGQWRGEYATESEARNLIEQRGGLIAIFDRQMVGHAQRVDIPVAGALGILSVNSEEIGAIFSGERWMAFGEKGMRALPHRERIVAAMWSALNG